MYGEDVHHDDDYTCNNSTKVLITVRVTLTMMMMMCMAMMCMVMMIIMVIIVNFLTFSNMLC